MKRIIAIGICCFCCMFALSGAVWAKGQSSGKKAVAAYYDAWYAMDAQKAYDSLAQADKDEMSLEEFTRTYGFNNFEEKLIRSKSSYKIVSVKEKGDQPTAEIKFIVPDNNALMERVFNIMSSFKSPNMTDAQIEEALLKQLKKEKIATLEMTTTVKLIKDNDGWHVFNDWATEKQIKVLLGKGWSATFDGDYITALAAYDEALKLDPNSREAADGRNKVAENARKMEADLAYASEHIELVNLVAAKKEIFQEMQPAVTLMLKNNGEKTLDALKIRVSYLDAAGQALNESTYDVLGGFIRPSVKPGEEYNLNTNFYPRDAQAWLDKWVEGSVKVEISGVEFRK